MTEEWEGTPFAQLVARLRKEMAPEDVQRLFERDGENPLCVLCRAHIPLPRLMAIQLAACYHHIEPRGMGGGSPNDLNNLAPACVYHHVEPYHSFRELWKRAMGFTNKAKTNDYPGLDPWIYPPLRECKGHFGYGSDYYKVNKLLTPTLQVIFAGKEDARLDDFCKYLCPDAEKCLSLTRARLMEEINR